MASLLYAVVTMVATLVGALIAFYVQRSIADRVAHRELIERVRRERLDAYAKFGGALIQYRLSELHRWHRETESPGSREARQAVNEAHRRRAIVFGLLCRLQILSDDVTLRMLATDAVGLIDLIHTATDSEQRHARGIQAGKQIELFVEHAAIDLGTTTGGGVVLPFKQ